MGCWMNTPVGTDLRYEGKVMGPGEQTDRLDPAEPVRPMRSGITSPAICLGSLSRNYPNPLATGHRDFRNLPGTPDRKWVPGQHYSKARLATYYIVRCTRPNLTRRLDEPGALAAGEKPLSLGANAAGSRGLGESALIVGLLNSFEICSVHGRTNRLPHSPCAQIDATTSLSPSTLSRRSTHVPALKSES
jgi:hypothetical protein